jgi:hypothetical protein
MPLSQLPELSQFERGGRSVGRQARPKPESTSPVRDTRAGLWEEVGGMSEKRKERPRVGYRMVRLTGTPRGVHGAGKGQLRQQRCDCKEESHEDRPVPGDDHLRSDLAGADTSPLEAGAACGGGTVGAGGIPGCDRPAQRASGWRAGPMGVLGSCSMTRPSSPAGLGMAPDG